MQNTGANLTIRTGSGSPYTKTDIVSGSMQGSQNGSRKPWRTVLDLRVDRDIAIHLKGESKAIKEMNLNVYLEITNLLNTQNIINVYSSTGNPNDNGFLAAAANQPFINSQVDAVAYRNYYSMAYFNNPGFYGLPRQIRFGISLGF
ncbi:MAG: hypothetical protein NTW49_07225 [Bacteroidia bacterium]|nr:hypothetical protein [Bacteroidia bacterium]